MACALHSCGLSLSFFCRCVKDGPSLPMVCKLAVEKFIFPFFYFFITFLMHFIHQQQQKDLLYSVALSFLI